MAAERSTHRPHLAAEASVRSSQCLVFKPLSAANKENSEAFACECRYLGNGASGRLWALFCVAAGDPAEQWQ